MDFGEFEIVPQIHIKKFEDHTAWGMRTGALLEVIFESHRVLWFYEDPVDVRNDSQQDTRRTAFSFFKSDLSLGSDFIPFFKKIHL